MMIRWWKRVGPDIYFIVCEFERWIEYELVKRGWIKSREQRMLEEERKKRQRTIEATCLVDGCTGPRLHDGFCDRHVSPNHKR